MRNTLHSSIYEVLDYGSALAHDEEFGIIITGNASYLNLWVARESNTWENVDCRGNQEERDLSKLKEKAEHWLNEIRSDALIDYENADHKEKQS